MKKVMKAEWLSGDQLVVATLSGKLNKEDVESWRNSMLNVLNLLSDNTARKMLDYKTRFGNAYEHYFQKKTLLLHG